MRAWVGLVLLVVPLFSGATALPDVPEAAPFVHRFEQAWGGRSATVAPGTVYGCTVTDGTGWVTSPPGHADDGACRQGTHTGAIVASVLLCPALTHCTLYAETRAAPYGAFQIHCFPGGQGASAWTAAPAAAQCEVITAGAAPTTWTAWWSWVSAGPASGGPIGANGFHVGA